MCHLAQPHWTTQLLMPSVWQRLKPYSALRAAARGAVGHAAKQQSFCHHGLDFWALCGASVWLTVGVPACLCPCAQQRLSLACSLCQLIARQLSCHITHSTQSRWLASGHPPAKHAHCQIAVRYQKSTIGKSTWPSLCMPASTPAIVHKGRTELDSLSCLTAWGPHLRLGVGDS